MLTRKSHSVQLAHGRTLTLGHSGVLMGVLNVTPDSFSDGGRFVERDSAVAQAQRLYDAGALIIDVGAESTRPGADQIDGDTERARLLPVIEAIVDALPDAVLSVDTYRADTASVAIAAGAHLLNDVKGLQGGDAMAAVAARTGAGLMIMHTNRDRIPMSGSDVVADQRVFLARSLDIAKAAGVDDCAIILDPGFGFGKDEAHNLALMARFEDLCGDAVLGRFPFAVGTSRKRFIGSVTGRDVDARDVATAATTALLRLKGATVFRVHDVAFNRDALAIADAMLATEVSDV